jgi:cytochrome c-type biogenesis protein CcmH/NrfF
MTADLIEVEPGGTNSTSLWQRPALLIVIGGWIMV